MSDSEEERRDAEALAAMRALIGKPLGAPSVAPDPVNQPMIRHWAAALEDHNPVYTDPATSRRRRASAASSRRRSCCRRGPWRRRRSSGIAERGGSPVEGGENPLTPLDEAGFIATLATNSEFEIVRYLRLGEVDHVDDGDRVGLRQEADAHRARATSSPG